MQINLAKKLVGTLNRPHAPCGETTEKCLNASLNHILSSPTVVALQVYGDRGRLYLNFSPG